ncbi:PTS glucitol/sorbitol transporter subunit IIA [Neobacillus cucumis]|uniref:PTS glucitol/sorbitol transporter subunit IIA n=1 Tax=Neobacillus cucumis TaxID=1740721 RepID=UPI00203A6AB0|nr:PTS glucitol/sorbitol transporter subunit IIA [Neobacillus cucumis]MCM3728178.1 PTS glucitol/sorbitol transporter subunit IIA [Neobacillus cucumis]
MYKSVVTEVGALALAFEEEKVNILFGPQAPQELKEVSIIHESVIDNSEVSIKEGGVFQVDDQEYKILAVGSAANNNLKELGHISIYFSEPENEVLPGAVFVSPSVLPKYKNGSVIEFKE